MTSQTRLNILCGGENVSNLEKAKARLRNRPKDYTYNEARQLLTRLGFDERTQGKTSAFGKGDL